MAGRFAYFLIAGAAVVGGMVLQGDIRFNDPEEGIGVAQALLSGDEREVDRRVDQIVDRQTVDVATRKEDRRTVAEGVVERELSEAVAELVRAEGSLITAKLDEDMPPAAIKQAEHRRDLARDAVERLSQDAKARSRGDNDALRETIRATVREAVRS